MDFWDLRQLDTPGPPENTDRSFQSPAPEDQQVDKEQNAGGPIDRASDRQDPHLRLVDPHDQAQITTESIIEAILFSTDQSVSAGKIAGIVGKVTPKQVRQAVEDLNSRYKQCGCAFRIDLIAGGYQMLTLSEYNPYLEHLHKVRGESRLSRAALETLAIVAYKQPATRATIEAIRGVACGEVLRSLMDKGLIKVVGRAEELGRPMLYGSTRKFLEVFGLNTLDQLPQVEELAPPQEDLEPPGAQLAQGGQQEAQSPPGTSEQAAQDQQDNQ